MRVAGVDVGGTNVMVGLVEPDGTVVERRKVPTRATAEGVLDDIVELVGDLDDDVRAVGIGLPGVVHEGRVLSLPNLDGWDPSTDVVEVLTERLGVPVAVENDAQVGVLGEWVAGAARGADSVLGVWLGTGVGAGLVLDGRPYTGRHGTAGEIGHVTYIPDGARCGCGRRGCVEAYAGRRMLGLEAKRLQDTGRTTNLFEIMEERGKPRPTSSVWRDALESGDEVANELFDRAIGALGVGIGAAVNLLDPELVVIGGGFAEKLGQPLADRIGRAVQPRVLHATDRRYVTAALEDDSGVVGAAWIARAALAAA
jgi:glucokinase